MRRTVFLKWAVAAAVAFTGTLGGAQDDKSITVQDLLRDQGKLNGQTVVVRGYLRECTAQSCFLYWRQQDWSSRRSPYYVSIGPDAAFDAAVSGHLPAKVTVKGQLDTRCANNPPKFSTCPGRAAALTHPEVVAWTR
jgi:hypothetical protein